jgi:hypothetical protein
MISDMRAPPVYLEQPVHDMLITSYYSMHVCISTNSMRFMEARSFSNQSLDLTTLPSRAASSKLDIKHWRAPVKMWFILLRVHV